MTASLCVQFNKWVTWLMAVGFLVTAALWVVQLNKVGPTLQSSSTAQRKHKACMCCCSQPHKCSRIFMVGGQRQSLAFPIAASEFACYHHQQVS
jgi:hypothetical protein